MIILICIEKIKRCFATFFSICSIFFVANTANSQSILFDGISNYAFLGNDASLHLNNFTLEAWIKIEGPGITTSTGTGGVVIVPILAKGRGESELASSDINFIIGYDPITNKLAADFEDNATSLNHPVTSNAALGNCWTHIASSYNTNNNTWKLYINGVLDKTLQLLPSVPILVPQSLSDVNASIGTTLNSTGIAEGFFNGKIDEVRIWNTIRTDAEILTNYNSEVLNGIDLVSSWNFNEGNGFVGSNSIIGGPNANLINNPLWKPGFNYNKSLLDFNGTSNYVTFGEAPGLNTSTFTLEAWIKIEGTGITTTTSGAGGGGFEGATAAVPVLTKGRGEAETPANVNMNYFMGLVGNKLAADFEETGGLNHSVISTNVIPLNIWTHIAATYEKTTSVWRLYINGVLDKTLDIGSNISPVNPNIQHAAVGTAMNSTGVAAGFFNGKIDEVRVWNVERTSAEILSNYNSEIISGTGLIGRWGFNETCGGLTTVNSVAGGVNGTLSSSAGPLWEIGNFNNLSPNQPANPSPLNNAIITNISPTLCATVSDPNGSNLQLRFFGRKKTATGSKFTIVGLPDTQFYTEEVQGTNSSGGGHNGIFKSQTQWIADHRIDSNIAFVVHLGDCVQNGDLNEIEWQRADTAIQKIEEPNVPLTYGIPYGICAGNHDQGNTGVPNGTNTFYNKYFGESRFINRNYYGGHYGLQNVNHYELFSADGIDFIHISIEYYPNGTTASLQPVLDWADALLKTHSNRKGILSSHNLLGTGNPASFQGPGQKIYDDLKDNPNLILMLAGHVPGEGRRTDVFNGNTIHTIMSDYQSGYTNGGNGYLRIMQFQSDLNLLTVKSYSPYSNTSFTGASSQFTLPVNIAQGYNLLGTNSNVTSGNISCLQWPSLEACSEYEWYVEVSNGENTTIGPVWTFTTNNPDDGNICTTDGCNSLIGEYHNPLSTNDNNACTVDGCNSLTGTFHNPVTSDDNNVCTNDGCNTLTGVFHTAVSIDDGNACTNDYCNTTFGVFHNTVSMDDGNPCTNDGCNSLTGVFHSAVSTDDGNVCTIDGCNSATGIFHTGIATDDGNVCTNDGCNSATGIFHTGIATDDGNVCTNDGCNSATGIFHTGIATDDGNVCTNDGCNSLTGVFNTTLATNDGNVCTADGCNSLTGVFHTGIATDDGNVCTNDGCNSLTGVFNTTLATNDGNVCTADGCNSLTGVFHNGIAIDDGNVCTNDGCNSLTGVFHTALTTDDGNVCTNDGCNSLTGVFHTALTTDDGNPCTDDGCNSITGISHNSVSTNDSNECTDDGCNTSSGVFHNSVSTDDENACTFDICNTLNGLITHSNISVDDEINCTEDGCNSITGIFHNSINCETILNSNILLQGYYLGGGIMTPNMNNIGVSINPLVADVVTLSAMDAAYPYGLIDAQIDTVYTNGNISVTFGPAVVQGSSYYLKINHRNSIETWSTLPVVLNASTTYTFSSAISQALNNGEALSEDGYALVYTGDINQDFTVDAIDFLAMDIEIQSGLFGYYLGDLNGDGAVDSSDFLLLDINIQLGIGSATP